MFVPRTFILAGIALIAISLGASGHGLWWLIGLVWAFGWMRDGRRSCHVGRRRERPERHGRPLDDGRDAQLPAARDGRPPATPAAAGPVAQPDPTRDRHEAFPLR